MAAFIIGLIGYGASLLCVLLLADGLVLFAKAPNGSIEERALLYAVGVCAAAAILLALATHWFIKVAL